ncbi:cellulose binding domain-containing protein [Phytohabitans kaempferiae]|uniref:Cellulose binding domain-containing protein n=1 Tax=Phytohabitans kaempferiae TaxID=1620943 RepID=A0ABV6M3W0_9ACTN
MSEIRMDVDLEHPAERIWRALTEEKVLSQWLELPGFAPVSEAEVTGVEGQRRLAMLWGNDELSTRLVWELAQTPDGATLTLRQSCVYGEWEDEQREEVRAAYDGVLHERLPAILDWLAFQEVDLTAPAPGSPVEPITQVIPFVVPGQGRQTRRRVVALATVACAFVAAVAVVALTRSGDEEPAASAPSGEPQPVLSTTTAPAGVAALGSGAPPTPSASASPTTQSPSATPSSSRPTEAATAPAGSAVLGAAYETTSQRLLGYAGEVIVSNTGRATAQQWAVVITLREGARVTDADGAEFRQQGRTVTFTGAALAAAASVTFQFEVGSGLGDDGPTACEVEGKPCA